MEKREGDDYHYDNGIHPKEVKLPSDYRFYPHSFGYLILNFIIIWATKIAFFFIKRFMGFRVKGKKNLKGHKHSNIVIANHIHQIDCLLNITTLYPFRTYITTLQSNLGFGPVSWYFRMGGAVPIPTDVKLLKSFNDQTKKALEKGRNIIFYPEAELYPYCDHIREFKNGAFHYAYMAKCNIIPMVYTFHKPKGIQKLFRKKKPCVHLTILKPYQMTILDNKRATIDKATIECYQLIKDYFDANNEYVDGKYKE